MELFPCGGFYTTMFEQSMVDAGIQRHGRKRIAVLLSFLVQASVALAAIVLPVLATRILPPQLIDKFVVAPALPQPIAEVPEHWTSLRPAEPDEFSPPRKIVPLPDALDAPPPLPHADVPINEEIGGDIGSAFLAPPVVAPVITAPKPALPAQPDTPIAIASEMQQARCRACPPPAYPQIARAAGISGTVILHAIIGADGRIQQLKVQSGNAFLAQAALRTVQGWSYEPLLLNGKAMAVETEITIKFSLNQN